MGHEAPGKHFRKGRLLKRVMFFEKRGQFIRSTANFDEPLGVFTRIRRKAGCPLVVFVKRVSFWIEERLDGVDGCLEPRLIARHLVQADLTLNGSFANLGFDLGFSHDGGL